MGQIAKCPPGTSREVTARGKPPHPHCRVRGGPWFWGGGWMLAELRPQEGPYGAGGAAWGVGCQPQQTPSPNGLCLQGPTSAWARPVSSPGHSQGRVGAGQPLARPAGTLQPDSTSSSCRVLGAHLHRCQPLQCRHSENGECGTPGGRLRAPLQAPQPWTGAPPRARQACLLLALWLPLSQLQLLEQDPTDGLTPQCVSHSWVPAASVPGVWVGPPPASAWQAERAPWCPSVLRPHWGVPTPKTVTSSKLPLPRAPPPDTAQRWRGRHPLLM